MCTKFSHKIKPASVPGVTVKIEPRSYVETYRQHHIPCLDGKLLANYPRTFTLTFCLIPTLSLTQILLDLILKEPIAGVGQGPHFLLII